MTTSTLDDLRRDIDRVDEVLVRLLNERARCVCEVGRLKKGAGRRGLSTRIVKRKSWRTCEALARKGRWAREAVARLFERIIDEARRLERRVVHDGVDPLEACRGVWRCDNLGAESPE